MDPSTSVIASVSLFCGVSVVSKSDSSAQTEMIKKDDVIMKHAKILSQILGP